MTRSLVCATCRAVVPGVTPAELRQATRAGRQRGVGRDGVLVCARCAEVLGVVWQQAMELTT